jgi:hypothetical protein
VYVASTYGVAPFVSMAATSHSNEVACPGRFQNAFRMDREETDGAWDGPYWVGVLIGRAEGGERQGGGRHDQVSVGPADGVCR